MPVTLEDIEDLSIEVKALVAAGLPLEGHLAAAGAGHSRRLQELTKSLSTAMQDGQSLELAVRNNKQGAPRILASAVAAGIRTGQLSESVEMLGDLAHDMVDMRRRVLRAIAYPLTIMAVAAMLFVMFIRGFLYRVDGFLDDSHNPGSEWFVWLIDLDRSYSWWPLTLPVIGVLCVLFWLLSGRANSLTFRGPERLLLLLPGVRGLIRDLHFCNLSRLLAMLVERETPLPDALQLAGACSGSRSLDQACQTMARRVQAGDIPAVGADEDWLPGAMPPMLMTCLRQASAHEQQFRDRLHSVAGYYRRRLDVSVLWLQNVVPVVMFVLLGGGTVLLFALTVFWPVFEVYQNVIPD